jgi:hypothetical protein
MEKELTSLAFRFEARSHGASPVENSRSDSVYILNQIILGLRSHQYGFSDPQLARKGTISDTRCRLDGEILTLLLGREKSDEWVLLTFRNPARDEKRSLPVQELEQWNDLGQKLLTILSVIEGVRDVRWIPRVRT